LLEGALSLLVNASMVARGFTENNSGLVARYWVKVDQLILLGVMPRLISVAIALLYSE
jgi:hypothetical protein